MLRINVIDTQHILLSANLLYRLYEAKDKPGGIAVAALYREETCSQSNTKRYFYCFKNTISFSEDNSCMYVYPWRLNIFNFSGSSTAFSATKRTISPRAIFA